MENAANKKIGIINRTVPFIFLSIIVCLFLTSDNLAWADRGSVSPWPVKLSEDSQRAIIMHNSQEEVLILGTELRAEKDTDVLEFIPFPSEPTVKLAVGNPFKEIENLVRNKNVSSLGWSEWEVTKGGGGTAPAPIEIKLSEKIGLHDVTVIKVNDISKFTEWVEMFFSRKGIKVASDLSSFYNNAEDYVKQGINYFVFDYVAVKTEKRSIEPLLYRFKTDKIYYPLKTSNVVGGKGIVDLYFICPGSFHGQKLFGLSTRYYPNFKLSGSNGTIFYLSNSARVYLDEIGAIYPEANEFYSKTNKLYIQVMRYVGPYNFKEDFLFDISTLDPRTYVWDIMAGSYPWDKINVLRADGEMLDKYINGADLKTDYMKLFMNRQYHILMGDETVTLQKGSYKKNPSLLNNYYLKVALYRVALGDLNGDDINDAAVILYSSGSGSGAFYELIALPGKAESFEQVDSSLLGDRIKVNSLAIINGIVTIDMLSHKENDPSCFPSQRSIKRFKLDGKELVEIRNVRRYKK
jgi:hypothetical protein